ncbi:MAG: hypothetical protein P1U41_09190, partial [Vicingaceae bacterium]|nr:hypothetical protein [Vicingaceae bacterium]
RIKNTKINYLILIGITVIICYYPFTYRPEGVVFEKNMFVLEENRLIEEEVAPFLKKELPGYSRNTTYFSHPYLSMALDIDYFDSKRHRDMDFLLTDQLEKGTIIIWDEWFSLMEGKVNLNVLIEDESFEMLQSFQRKEKDRIIQFVVFIKN